jgi:putative ABC transport system permease protein
MTSFLFLFYRFVVRSMRARPWRILAVLFGIALGAGVFTSVRLAVDASLDSFSNSMDLISGKADFVVTQTGGRVPEYLVAELLNHPAIESASPLLTTYVQATGPMTEPFLLIGLDPILDSSLRNWQLDMTSAQPVERWLDLVRRPCTIFLSRRLAQATGLRAGDSLRLEHVNRIEDFKVSGTLKPQGLGLVEGGYMALVDIATFQEFVDLHGTVDRIDIRLAPNVPPEAVTGIRNRLPPGAVLESPSDIKETGRAMIRAYQLNLSLLSFVSLCVGMFLVYSLVSLNAATRRRELAVLRSLGASAQNILMLVLCEGLLLGVLGWLLAIPVASVLVGAMVRGVSSTVNNLFVRVHVEGLNLDGWEILLSFLVTAMIALLASYRPARDAMRIVPREALFSQGIVTRTNRSGRRMTAGGLILIAVTWPLSQLPGPAGVPLAGYLAIFVLVTGFSLLAPAILSWMGTYLAPLLRRHISEAAFLGGRYVRDAGGRTAIAVGALITATALFVALTIMVHSFRQTVTLWVEQSIVGDLFLRPKMAGLNRYRDPLPDDVVRFLEDLPPTVDVLPYRTIYLHEGRVPYQLEAIDIAMFLRHGDFVLLEGGIEEIMGPLIAGEGVLISEVFHNKTGLGTGQPYRVDLGDGILESPVLGIIRDYRTEGGIVYTALKHLETVTGNRTWSGARIFFDQSPPDREASVERLRIQMLERFAQRHPLEMASGVELRRDVLRIFDETFAVTTVLLLIALLVATLGIATTLSVMVLERIRHLNTLCAVGASYGQIRSMIFWEAVFMVAAGEVLGVICGFVLAHLLIDVINLHAFGWTFLYQVNWRSLIMSLPLILATALIAALPAAHLVIRSSPGMVLKEQQV